MADQPPTIDSVLAGIAFTVAAAPAPPAGPTLGHLNWLLQRIEDLKPRLIVPSADVERAEQLLREQHLDHDVIVVGSEFLPRPGEWWFFRPDPDLFQIRPMPW